MDAQLLEILVCPETKGPIRLAEPDLLERLNAAIQRGEVENRGGAAVTEPLDEGLVREDGKVIYPVRDGIPIMLIDEAILLDTEEDE